MSSEFSLSLELAFIHFSFLQASKYHFLFIYLFFLFIYLFIFHHTTCKSTCDTLASSAANQGDNSFGSSRRYCRLCCLFLVVSNQSRRMTCLNSNSAEGKGKLQYSLRINHSNEKFTEKGSYQG